MESYSIRQLLITMLEYELKNYVGVRLPDPTENRFDLLSYQSHLESRLRELKSYG